MTASILTTTSFRNAYPKIHPLRKPTKSVTRKKSEIVLINCAKRGW